MTTEEEKKRWEAQTLNPAIQRFPERKRQFTTTSGIPLPASADSGDIRLSG